jgi:5-(carboxyamino)imidazole ribonucleotide mutase
VGTKQLAAIGLVSATRLPEHSKGSAQGLNAAGHQSGTDRFNAITPELIEELQELRQRSLCQLWERQSKSPIDLEVHTHRTKHISIPAFTGHGRPIGHDSKINNPVLLINLKPPPRLRMSGLGRAVGQTDVCDPAHGEWSSEASAGRWQSRCKLAVSKPSEPTIVITPRVAVIMGSDSDLPTLKPAVAALEELGVNVEVRVLSAHRTPLEMVDFARHAKQQGFRVIVAGAGGAAHLPGMVASLTTLPVIGVPVKSRALSGVDSLHSIVQMPGGIPVATVAIGGGLNAGLLAAQILAISDSALSERLEAYRQQLHDMVVAKDARLKDLGVDAYLDSMSSS